MSAFAGRPFRQIQATPKGKSRKPQVSAQRVVYGDVVPGRSRREKRAAGKAAQREMLAAKRLAS